MIKTYSDFLLDSKQVGNLYHIVDLEKIMYILNNNKITNYNFLYISTTRDKSLNGYVGDNPTSIFKLDTNVDIPKDFKLYLCDFIYNNEDIIEEDGNFVHLKKTKLHNIDVLI